MTKALAITISGHANAGRSTLAALIAKMLDELDVVVTVKDDDGIGTQLQNLPVAELGRRLVHAQMRDASKVEIVTVQLPRACSKPRYTVDDLVPGARFEAPNQGANITPTTRTIKIEWVGPDQVDYSYVQMGVPAGPVKNTTIERMLEILNQ